MTKNGRIDLKEYGRMCQKIEDLEERFDKFIDNEFEHLTKKVDWMFTIIIITLLGLAADLAILLIKK